MMGSDEKEDIRIINKVQFKVRKYFDKKNVIFRPILLTFCLTLGTILISSKDKYQIFVFFLCVCVSVCPNFQESQHMY